MQRPRRGSARLAVTTAALLALTACGGAATSEQPAASDGSGARPFEGQTVTVAVGSFMSSGVTMFQEEWEKRTGATLEVVEIPFGDLYQRLFASFNTGAGRVRRCDLRGELDPGVRPGRHILSLEQYYDAEGQLG